MDQSDLSLEFFSKLREQKYLFFVTQIAINNIQCRAGVRPALQEMHMSSDADSASKESQSFA